MVSMWDSKKDAVPERGLHTGISATAPRSAKTLVDFNHEEADLLNGPQMPGKGLGQDAVDALFGAAAGESAASPAQADADEADASTPPPPAAPPHPAVVTNGSLNGSNPAKSKAAPASRKAPPAAAKAPPATMPDAALPGGAANGATPLDQSSIDAP